MNKLIQAIIAGIIVGIIYQSNEPLAIAIITTLIAYKAL